MKKEERYFIIVGILMAFVLQIAYDMIRELITEFGTLNLVWYISQLVIILIVIAINWKLLNWVNKHSEN